MKPLCFVLMPFGRKNSGAGQTIDFDYVYSHIIKPAIEKAGLDPIRADEEAAGGIIHKAMFERLVLCDYAVADLTTANANVFYELGVRHAAKPRSTVLMFAEGHGRLPFDVAQLRAYPYHVDDAGNPNEVDEDRAAIIKKLENAISGGEADSPLWQLLDGYPNEIDHKKTDAFRDRVEIEKSFKSRLFHAREHESIEKLEAIEKELGDIKTAEAGVIVDLLLSYRALSSWANMIRLAEQVEQALAKTVLVREQLGFALNRAGRRHEAEKVLVELIEERGPSSETNGILGRVYKDLWIDAAKNGGRFKVMGYLDKAISTYIEGFEDDWRDAYPGINALTLLYIAGERAEEYDRLRPVVGYALERKQAAGDVDYWDYATNFELAILDDDEAKAIEYAQKMLATMREGWELLSTINNLKLVLKYRGRERGWAKEVLNSLIEESEK